MTQIALPHVAEYFFEKAHFGFIIYPLLRAGLLATVPTRAMTRDPGQNIHHSKRPLQTSNKTVDHSSRLVEYDPSYGILNFHENPRVTLCFFS